MTMCQRCKKSQATVHLTDIIPPNGEKRERHLCERCAAEEGVTVQKQETITTLLEGFVKQSAGITSAADALACPRCGMTFREFRAHGLLGCPEDYKVFAKHLGPLIERAHGGATHHVGKAPGSPVDESPNQVKLSALRRTLKEALDIEDYEQAAKIRDELKALEPS